MKEGETVTTRFGSWSYWRDQFFGTRDRALTSASAIVSILSLILSGILAWAPVPLFIVVRDLLVIGVLLLLLGALLFKYVRRERTIERLRTQMEQKDLFEHAQQLVKNYKQTLFYNYCDESLTKRTYIFDDHDTSVVNDICSFLTLSVRESVIRHLLNRNIDINDDVSVTVKLIVSSSEIIESWHLSPEQAKSVAEKERWLITVYRDPHTHNKFLRIRETRRKIYDIRENTAFDHVINSTENEFYCQNDLKSLGPAYKNENLRWREFYNSTMVVPIRYCQEHVNGSTLSKSYGVLTVDSLNPRKLELYGEDTLPILQHAADLLATLFLTFELTDLVSDTPVAA